MKIDIQIDPTCPETKVVIHTARLTPEIEALARQLSTPSPDVLAAQTGSGMEILPVGEIIRIYSERQKVFAQTRDGIFTLRARLYELEEKLSGGAFVRISSSELVNTKMITGMDFSLTGTIRLSLKGGVTTYVARRRVSEIKKLFDL